MLELLRALWPYTRPYRSLLLVAALLLPIAVGLQILQPLTIRYIIDQAILPKSYPRLFTGCLLYLGLAIGEYFAIYLHVAAITRAAQRTLYDLRSALLQKLLAAPMSYFDNLPTGRLVSRVTNDVENLSELFTTGIAALAKDLVLLISTLGLLIYLSPQLSLALGVVLPLLLLFGWRMQKILQRAYAEVRQQLTLLNGYLAESLEGVGVIKSFQAEEKNAAKFDLYNRNYLESNFLGIRSDALLYSVVEAGATVTVALVIGGAYVLNSISLGTVVAFLEYLGRFFTPVRDLSAKVATLQMALVSGQRVVDVLNLATEGAVHPPNPHPANAQSPEISIRSASLSYRPEMPALRNVSLEVFRREKIAIVGPTGGGKTSLIRMLMRFYPFQSGEIWIRAQDQMLPLQEIPLEQLRGRRFGLVLQDSPIFDGTAASNITLKTDLNEAEKNRLAEIFERLELDRHFLVETALGTQGRVLSLGQQQLLACARILFYDPEIVILDEATSRLDAETEGQVLRAIEKVLENRTSIVIAHRLTTIRKADRILVVHKGEIQASGKHDQLMQDSELYRTLVTHAGSSEFAAQKR